jgi:hypothetical protein
MRRPSDLLPCDLPSHKRPEEHGQDRYYQRQNRDHCHRLLGSGGKNLPATPVQSNLPSIPAPSCRKARFLGFLEAMPVYLAMAAPRCVALPATHAHPPAMFSVTKAEATAIRDAFHQRGELSAVIELRRLFPGVTDNRQARDCVRMIASWRLSEPDQPRRLRRTSTL